MYILNYFEKIDDPSIYTLISIIIIRDKIYIRYIFMRCKWKHRNYFYNKIVSFDNSNKIKSFGNDWVDICVYIKLFWKD